MAPDTNFEPEILEFEGQQFKLACQLPTERPTTFTPLADAVPILTMDQIAEIINDPKRKWGRKRWGADWIYNQGQIGQCNASAAARALMRTRDVKGLDFLELSSEFIYANINGGQDRGSMLDDGMNWIMEQGTCPQDMVPHQLWRKDRLRPETYNEAPRFKALEGYRADTELEMASGLALGFIGVIAVHATNAFMRLNEDGIVHSTDGPGNHAVGVDDVRIHNGELQFDMFNSWSTRYGDQGRGWVSWKRHLRTTVRFHSFYLLRSATDDPQGEKVPDA